MKASITFCYLVAIVAPCNMMAQIQLSPPSIFPPQNENGDRLVNPCSTVRCGNNEVCMLQNVVCATAPCNPVAVCVERPECTLEEVCEKASSSQSCGQVNDCCQWAWGRGKCVAKWGDRCHPKSSVPCPEKEEEEKEEEKEKEEEEDAGLKPFPFLFPLPVNPPRDGPIVDTPPPRLVCPPVPEGTFGICVQACDGNDDCSDGQLCCSNGCGNVCTDGVAE